MPPLFPPSLITHLVRRVLLVTMLVIAVAGCHSMRSVLRSDLTVQPGKQFVLGGNQRGAFSVQATNKGTVPVTLSEQRINGQTTPLGTFSPGSKQTIRLAAGSAVLVTNSSTQSARLDLIVTGDKNNLTMQERLSEKP